MPLWPWLLLALAGPSDAKEDDGARAPFGGRLPPISAFERFLVGGGAWVLYAVFIVLYIVYKVRSMSTAKDQTRIDKALEEARAEAELTKRHGIDMMKTQQELQKIERELAEQMQAMETRIAGLTETVQIDQLQGQIEGMQTLLDETATSRKKIQKTDLRMRKNRLNADIGMDS